MDLVSWVIHPTCNSVPKANDKKTRISVTLLYPKIISNYHKYPLSTAAVQKLKLRRTTAPASQKRSWSFTGHDPNLVQPNMHYSQTNCLAQSNRPAVQVAGSITQIILGKNTRHIILELGGGERALLPQLQSLWCLVGRFVSRDWQPP